MSIVSSVLASQIHIPDIEEGGSLHSNDQHNETTTRGWSCYQISLVVSGVSDGLVIIAGIVCIVFGYFFTYSPLLIAGGSVLIIEGSKAMAITIYCSTLLSISEQVERLNTENDEYRVLNDLQAQQINDFESANDEHQLLNRTQEGLLQTMQEANQAYKNEIDEQAKQIAALVSANEKHAKLNQQQADELSELKNVRVQFSGTLAELVKIQKEEQKIEDRLDEQVHKIEDLLEAGHKG
jgi:hypothetical protein